MKRFAVGSVDRVGLLAPEAQLPSAGPTVISAPPGFGKTRLLKAAEATFTQRNMQVVRTSDWQVLRSARTGMDQAPAKRLWLLDDLHPDAGPGFVDALIEAAERGWFVIAATRYRSMADIVSLAFPGRTRRIEADSLRLTDDEVRDLVSLPHADERVDLLDRMTMRWPMGIKLLSTCVDDFSTFDAQGLGSRAAAMISTYFDGLGDYFDDKILDLVALVAGIDQVSSGTIAEAFENPSITAALRTLSRAGAFVTEDIGAESVFTIHPMFSEYLRNRTPTTEWPADEMARACLRLARLGHAKASLRLAPSSKDASIVPDLAATIGGFRLQMTAPGKVMRFHAVRAPSAFDALDLTISNLYSKLIYGQTAEAAQAMRSLNELPSRCSELDGAKREIARLVFLYHSGAPICVDEVAGVERRYDQILAGETFLKALLGHLKSTAYYRQGLYKQSLSALASVREASDALGAPLLNAFQLLSVGLTRFRMGHIAAAVEALRQAKTVMKDSFGGSSAQAAYTSLLLSHVLSELGEDQEADDLWRRHAWAIDLYPGWREGVEVTLESQLRRTLRDRGPGEAREVIDAWEASRNAEVRANFAGRTALLRARVEMVSGRLAAAEEQLLAAAGLRNAGLMVDDLLASVLAERIGVELGRRASSLTENLVAAESSVDDVFVKFAALFTRYRYQVVSRRDEAASEAFRQVVAVARRYRLHSTLRDEALNIGQRDIDSITDGDDQAFLERVDLAPARGVDQGDREGLELLSAREEQVLRFLIDGLSSKEMAARLDISAGSVQGYRKRLYEKLGVHHRSQAVQAARTIPALA